MGDFNMRRWRPLSLLVLAGLALVGGLVGCSSATPAPLGSTSDGAADRAQQAAACLRGLGWEVTIGDDGSVQSSVPRGQEDAYDAAQRECWSGFPVQAFDELEPSKQKDVYTKQTAVRDCLVGLGEDLPPAPSFQQYLEGDGIWSPYMDIPMEELASRSKELLKACPQVTEY